MPKIVTGQEKKLKVPEKTMNVELTEQDSSIIIVSLELRELTGTQPMNQRDRSRLPLLKKELAQRHAEAFHNIGKLTDKLNKAQVQRNIS